MLYNGVDLPVLPETDYQYAIVQDLGNGVGGLMLATVEMYADGINMKAKSAGTYASYSSETGAWVQSVSGSIAADELLFYNTAVCWANYDIKNADGSLYLAGSEPITGDEKYSILAGTMAAIGLAIRKLKGSKTLYKPTEMPAAIRSISGGGGTGGGECTGTHVIEVDELPTENIDGNALYLCGGAYHRYEQVLSDVLLYGGPLSNLMGGATIPYYYASTKPTENIMVSSDSGLHIYYIEDENDLFMYGDFAGTGENAWMALSTMFSVPFLGVISDASEATDTSGLYAVATNGFQTYALPPKGTLEITENGTYDVSDKDKVLVAIPEIPRSIVVSTVDNLPTDVLDGSMAIVLNG